jgi:hypothetical protein
LDPQRWAGAGVFSRPLKKTCVGAGEEEATGAAQEDEAGQRA